MAGSILGNNVRRIEDPRLITGQGRYIDDLEAADALYLRAVRSQIPHGTINSIDTEEAKQVPGVVDVLTAADIDLPPNRPTRPADIATSRHLLATDKVRFVGEVLAVIVAENPVAAADAAELVWAENSINPNPIKSDTAVVDPTGFCLAPRFRLSSFSRSRTWSARRLSRCHSIIDRA